MMVIVCAIRATLEMTVLSIHVMLAARHAMAQMILTAPNASNVHAAVVATALAGMTGIRKMTVACTLVIATQNVTRMPAVLLAIVHRIV